MLRALPALLEAQVKATGHEFIRSSFTGFAPSSLDFELIFDVHDEDYDKVAAARTDLEIRPFDAMTGAGYDFDYPTQTSFPAALGRMSCQVIVWKYVVILEVAVTLKKQ